MVTLPVVKPQQIDELSQLIRQAVTTRQGLYPDGGGVFRDTGLPPSKPGRVVDMTGFNQVIDYPSRDMTITVQTGITIAQLQAQLRESGQQLPIDLPKPNELTLGAALAMNLSGPRRLQRGTLRDYLIGIRFMTDGGDEVQGGGRVVKNVAGYDLMKLHIGAMGTLGILTQATLKVVPLPEQRATVAFGLSTAAIGPTLDRLHHSHARPAFVELLNLSAARVVAAQAGLKLPEFEPWVIIVGFEEKAKTVAWQMETILEELKSAPVRELTSTTDAAQVEALIAALTDFQTLGSAKFIWKATILPSRLSEFVNAAAAPEASMLIHAHALNGIVWLFVDSDSYDPLASQRLVELDQAVIQCGGSLLVRRCPEGLRSSLRLWGRPRPDWELMKTVKKTLDRHDVFNPGKLFPPGLTEVAEV